MTRLQKKCFLISAGMHGLLLAILLGSSAFRDKPETSHIPILTMIPANILDAPGAGGGSPEPSVAPPPSPSQPQPQPAPPVVQPQPHVAQQPPPKPVERPQPREPVERPQPREAATEPTEPVSLPKKTTAKRTHDIQIDFTPATVTSRKTKVKPAPTDTASDESASSSRADARSRRQELAQALEALATGVRNSGAKGTVVDMPGQGGGEAFAGYETVIYNAYYHAWSTPDSVADKLAGADVKIVVARDGRIISAEIIKRSGERALDRSVENALQAVTRLPPFPAGAHDEQRTFLLRFNLEAKEGSG